MKKILAAIFAVVVTAAWVLPAMAVDTTFYGTYRVRAFSTNNNNDYAGGATQTTYTGVGSNTTQSAISTDENSWIDQRFRLGIDTKVSDNLRAFVQLQIGNSSNTSANRSTVWGDGTYGSEVIARQAYIAFNAGPVRLKAGRQIFGDAPDGGQSFRVSDDKVYWGLLDGGLVVVAKVDAILAAFKPADQIAVAAGYVRLTEGSTSGSTTTDKQDRDNTAYIIEGVFTPSDTLTAAAYLVYDSDRTTIAATGVGENNPYWLGVGVDAKQLGPVNLKAHAVYLGGSKKNGCQPGSCGIAATAAAADLSYSAYALDVDVNTKIDQLTLGVAAGIGSGDNSSQDKTSGNYMGVAGAYGVQLGVRPAIFFDNGEVSNGGAVLNVSNSTGANGLSQKDLGNITFAQIYGIYKATDDLTLNGLFAYFMNTETKRTTGASTSTTWDSVLGSELDLNAVYKLYKELAITAQAAWFMPGDGILKSKDQAGNYSGITNNDTVSEYYVKAQLDF